MATEQAIREVRNRLDQAKKFDKDKLISRPAWGEINFEEARLDFDRIFGLLASLEVMPLELLPDSVTSNLQQKLESINTVLSRVDGFSLKNNNNPTSDRNSLISNIHTEADQFYSVAAQWIPFLAYKRGDVDNNIQQLTSSLTHAKTLVNQAKEEIESRGREIQDIITKAREASAGAGAAVFTKDFENLATKQETDAYQWLKVTIGAAGITLVVTSIIWLFPQTGLDNAQVIQRLTTKLVLLGVLVSATVWCGRNYKALKHLATINRHRATSILTLQAFSAAASDPSVKDAVLLEATRAVFGNVPTGYIESLNSDGDLKVIEVARNLLPKGGNQ